MSWSVNTQTTVDGAADAIDAMTAPYPLEPGPQEQLVAAKSVAKVLAPIVAQDDCPGLSISLVGHAYTGPGWHKQQSISVSISELADAPAVPA